MQYPDQLLYPVEDGSIHIFIHANKKNLTISVLFCDFHREFI